MVVGEALKLETDAALSELVPKWIYFWRSFPEKNLPLRQLLSAFIDPSLTYLARFHPQLLDAPANIVPLLLLSTVQRAGTHSMDDINAAGREIWPFLYERPKRSLASRALAASGEFFGWSILSWLTALGGLGMGVCFAEAPLHKEFLLYPAGFAAIMAIQSIARGAAGHIRPFRNVTLILLIKLAVAYVFFIIGFALAAFNVIR